MPRPINKEELIIASNTNFDKLMKLVDSMSDKEMNTVFDFSDDLSKKEAHWKRDKNVRDIFVHLIKWQELLLNWVDSNTKGLNLQFLMEGYSWKTYGDMNMVFYQNGQNKTYEEAKSELINSHKKVMGLVDKLSNEELFERKHFSWTGTNQLGAYFISTTSSHYDWAMKKIKAHIKKVNDK